MEKESRTFSKMEHKVARGVSQFFAKLEKEILQNIEEHWGYISFTFQLPKISEPILRLQDDYQELLNKELTPAYNQGKNIAKRRYAYAKQLSENKSITKKSEDYFYSSSLTKRIKKIRWTELEGSNISLAEWKRTTPSYAPNSLFGISSDVFYELNRNNFVASEKTMNRVNQEINSILSTSYMNGEGIDDCKKSIQHKFNQLKTWEAQRIARTETHTAQELGIQAEYDNLGVQYTQWLTHIDERTRTSHEAINLEIIPRGGTFSNGLRYPGDKQGRIEEWINCRCVDIPYIPPYGMMFPPGQPRYKESDLIPNPNANLDIQKFSIDDLLSGDYKNKLKGKFQIPTQLSEKRIKQLIDDVINENINIQSEEEFEALLKEYEKRLILTYSDEASNNDFDFIFNFEEYVSRESIDFGLDWDDRLYQLREDWILFEYLKDPTSHKIFEKEFENLSEKEILKKLNDDYGINKKSLSKFKNIYSKLKKKPKLKRGKQLFIDFMDKFYYGNKSIKPSKKTFTSDLLLTNLQQERYKKLLEIKKRKGQNWERYVDARIRDYGENPDEELQILETTLHDTKIKSVTSETLDFKKGGWWGQGKSVGKIEEFNVYTFVGEDYKIYISKELDNPYLTPTNLRKIINSKGKIHKDASKNIIFSNQKASIQGRGGYSTQGGTIVMFKANYEAYDEYDMIYSFGKLYSENKARYLRCIHTIEHEGGHGIDRAFETYLFSRDPEYIRRVNLDHDLIKRKGGVTPRPKGFHNGMDRTKIWVTDYARTKRYNGRPDLEYVECWAEQVEAYLVHPQWFKENYPNSYEYIDDLFKIYEKDGNITRFIKKYNVTFHGRSNINIFSKYANDEVEIHDLRQSNQLSDKYRLSKKDEILLKDLEKLKKQKGKLNLKYENIYKILSSQKRFNELYSLKLKHGGLNRRNTKLYIREYIKLREMGYKFPKGKLDIFKDIDINFALGKYNKSILKELYKGGYATRLRYELGLIDLTDDELYYLLSMYLSPTPPGVMRGLAISSSDWVTGD